MMDFVECLYRVGLAHEYLDISLKLTLMVYELGFLWDAAMTYQVNLQVHFLSDNISSQLKNFLVIHILNFA